MFTRVPPEGRPDRTTTSRGKRSIWLAIAGGIGALPVMAGAQTLAPPIHEPDDAAGNRKITEYTPIGYDLAGFNALPEVAFAARVDDNVFADDTRRRSDIEVTIAPKITARRLTRSSRTTLEADAQINRFGALTSQNSNEYAATGAFTHFAGGDNSVTVGATYRREVVQRGTAENDLPFGEPLIRRVLQSGLQGRKRFNRLAFDGAAKFVRMHYEDVELGSTRVIDQRFRNGERYSAQLTASYEISGRTTLFAGGSYDRFDYRTSPTLANRDADAWSAAAGVSYELSHVLVAQLALGERRYDFVDPALGHFSGLSISGQLRYFPTRLLSIRGSIDQTNTTSPYDLVGAVTLTTARIEGEYEMRRGLSWVGKTQITFEDYASKDYSARNLSVSAGPRWRINRWLSADATIGHDRRFTQGTAPFAHYRRTYAVLTVTLAR
jgi:hypothetical protein